jgi:dipeptidyl aminopeptidase/acylaminoacyl peptidase
MDFRISRGYGRKLFTAGFKQLGLKMQDDKTDGLNWLVAQGIADPKRACIYGGSYGGYAALWGVTRDPDLYRCAINAVGVSDWEIIMRGLWYSGRETYGPDEISRWVGDIDNAEDRARFDATSPVKLAARIKAPILHGYGFNDPRVPIEHLKVMERALEANDKKTESVTYDNEGHGWANPENRLDWYRRMEKFLARHNPAD